MSVQSTPLPLDDHPLAGAARLFREACQGPEFDFDNIEFMDWFDIVCDVHNIPCDTAAREFIYAAVLKLLTHGGRLTKL